MSKRYYPGDVSPETLDVVRVAPFLRTEYNYDVDLASLESGLTCSDESRTKQAMAEEVDINVIVKRFGLTGQMPQGVRMPTYDDFTLVTDYQTALQALTEAEMSFMKMPAEVRSRFDNNAAKFVDFCSDERNMGEAVKLGLVSPRPCGAGGPAGDVDKEVATTSFAS